MSWRIVRVGGPGVVLGNEEGKHIRAFKAEEAARDELVRGKGRKQGVKITS